MTAAPESTCRDCGDDVAHCHAAWVRHGEWGECIVATCHLGPESHVHVVACVDFDAGCCC